MGSGRAGRAEIVAFGVADGAVVGGTAGAVVGTAAGATVTVTVTVRVTITGLSAEADFDVLAPDEWLAVGFGTGRIVGTAGGSVS